MHSRKGREGEDRRMPDAGEGEGENFRLREGEMGAGVYTQGSTIPRERERGYVESVALPLFSPAIPFHFHCQFSHLTYLFPHPFPDPFPCSPTFAINPTP